MTRDELNGWLRLTLTPGVGNETSRKLLAAFGLPATLFIQSQTALRQVVSERQAAALVSEPPGLPELLQITWDWLQARDNQHGERQIVALGDAGYPAALLTIEDPPIMLYLLGQCAAPQDRATLETQEPSAYAPYLLGEGLGHSLAIVGSRNPTAQGAQNARQFARALCAGGMTIVSGLALGVDAQAHEGALEGVQQGAAARHGMLATVAVVGTGLDRVYPKAHLDLARRIAQHGLLISEYPIGTPPLAVNFPRRNRLIAGLTRGTLVVEAALKSGSLITARLAAEQGKEVFAIPGSIHSILSRGCHALIRQGAKLVETDSDILEELGLQTASKSIAKSADKSRASEVSESENSLLIALGFDPVGLESLAARTGLETSQLLAGLMALELEGHVGRLPGGLFQRMGLA